MQDVNIQSNSSSQTSSQTLAPKTLLRALAEFANTGNQPDRAAYFLNKRWPGFLEGMVEESTKAGTDFSDNPNGIGMMLFRIQGGGNPLGPFQHLRDCVRLAWEGNEAAIEFLLRIGLEEGKSNLVMPDWRRSGFRYEPRTNFQAAVYELLKHSAQARVCANPDCANPYFLTLDPRRKFCSVECTRPAQKEWRRRWWEHHGKQWRKQQASKNPTKRGTKR